MHFSVSMDLAAMSGGGINFNRFAREYPQTKKVLRILNIDWPCAQHIYENFVLYVSDGLVFEGKPLAFYCLNKALTCYEGVLGENDETRFNSFLTTLVEAAAEVLADVEITDDKYTWHASDGTPLTLWLDNLHATTAELSKSATKQEVRMVCDAIHRYVLEHEALTENGK